MRRIHIYALSAAVALASTLVLVLAGGEPRTGFPGNPELVSAAADPTTTTIDLVIPPDEHAAQVLSAQEVQLTEEAAASTTTPPSTTTTVAARSASKGTPASPSPTTTEAQPSGVTAGFRSDHEADFGGRINSLRSSNGLPSLSNNGSLKARARDWAKRMAESGSLSHSNISSLLPPWSAAGENVGMGGSVSSIFSGLAGSGGHRQNMLGDFTHMGVGVWVDESGVLWTAHVFAR